MSYWTYVSGLIFFNDELDDYTLDKLKERLGEPFTYRDDRNKTIPYGSEGSIQYTISKIRKSYNAYDTFVLISGNLRDRCSVDFDNSIADWFLSVVENTDDYFANDYRLEINGYSYRQIRNDYDSYYDDDDDDDYYDDDDDDYYNYDISDDYDDDIDDDIDN